MLDTKALKPGDEGRPMTIEQAVEILKRHRHGHHDRWCMSGAFVSGAADYDFSHFEEISSDG